MKSKRINISSGSPYEDIAGYSRAVRIENHIYVSGTTATINEKNKEIAKDPYLQTIHCIDKIKLALTKAGASLSDVVRIRIFVVNIKDWKIIAKALNESFANIKPAATMVEVNGLISNDLLVEIEADAYCSN